MRILTRLAIITVMLTTAGSGATIGGITFAIDDSGGGVFPGFASFGVQGTLTKVSWAVSVQGTLRLSVFSTRGSGTTFASGYWVHSVLGQGKSVSLWGMSDGNCDVDVEPPLWNEGECFDRWTDFGYGDVTDPASLVAFSGMAVLWLISGGIDLDVPPDVSADYFDQFSGTVEIQYEYQPLAAIPEPATGVLLLGGIVVLAACRKVLLRRTRA